MMLEAKRRVIGQMIVCRGCCYGATYDAGHLLELPREFKDHLMGPWRSVHAQNPELDTGHYTLNKYPAITCKVIEE